MHPLPDEGTARWLDACELGLCYEAQATLDAAWEKPGARRAVLHYLGDIRAAREGKPSEARSTRGEWAARVSRLTRHLDAKERAALAPELAPVHPAIRVPSCRVPLELAA